MSEDLCGVRLGLDWGKARIGVAACDRDGVLAYPVETITPAADQAHVLRRLRAVIDEYEPVVAYLGLPRHLKGAEGESAAMARGQARWLADRFPGLQVRLIDERMTTVTASRQLHEAGRSARSQRGVIDQAAAVAILNHALDAERHTGARAGERIDGRTSDS
ncbi:MAG: Holliday junction resolvase RuvX [Propioniciclava sp.]|uniref:Holliday junction resolvase RuvX n=1 Tax=Propioniciclava sp. TaxID=2038686 RepID=UPI0039E59996